MKQGMDTKLAKGPLDTQGGDELPSHLVATMWLCMLSSLDQDSLDTIGDCNMAVAFDLGIAVQVAEEQQIPLDEIMAEVFEYYNERMDMDLASRKLATLVAERYQRSLTESQVIH